MSMRKISETSTSGHVSAKTNMITRECPELSHEAAKVMGCRLSVKSMKGAHTREGSAARREDFSRTAAAPKKKGETRPSAGPWGSAAWDRPRSGQRRQSFSHNRTVPNLTHHKPPKLHSKPTGQPVWITWHIDPVATFHGRRAPMPERPERPT